MAKTKKDKVKEEKLAIDKTSPQDADAEEGEQDSEDEGKKEVSEPKGKFSFLKGIDRKGLLIGLLVFIFVGGGAIAIFKSGLMNTIIGKKHSLPPVDLTSDNLKEESLSPFFVPPSSDLSRGAVRIDLTVIWDGLASVRFKSNELRVRAETYEYLKGFTEKTMDLSSQKSIMEEEMGAIFRKSLGVNNLAIRIKELKVI
jgi:hypothetical protein